MSFVRVSVGTRKMVGWHYTRFLQAQLSDSAAFAAVNPRK
jgi:hypothetical protein